MKKCFYLLGLLLFALYTSSLQAQVTCSFTASVTSGCAPLSVAFTNQSIGADSYYWEFDYGGNSSTLQNPSANYPDPGIYNVKLVASNGVESDTMYLQIHVFRPPVINFTSTDNNGCNNPCHLTHFTNQTIFGESAVADTNFVWNFGDGSQPQRGYNATHCYNQVGSFSVTLIALDDNGCQVSQTLSDYVAIGASPSASASATPTQSCATLQLVNFTGSGASPNGAVTYRWSFGNGSSTQQNHTQAFNCGIYESVLSVTDALGCVGTDTVKIEVPCVKAGFTVSSVNGCSGIALQFTDTSNFATSWSWDFGDGSTSTVQNPIHAYSSNGTYSVSLTVTYAGCTDTKTKTSYINISSPVAFALSANDNSNCTAPFAVNFSSNVTSGTASGYIWSFGDGDSSVLANPSHTYTSTGTYTVTLGVANANGCVNTKTLNNPVAVGALNVGFLIDSLNGCTPLTVHFANTSTSDVPVNIFNWQFGDGGTSNARNPFHTYLTEGLYVPVLTATDANGCTKTYICPDTIRVGKTLTPDFVASPLEQCVNHDIVFTNLTADATSQTKYLWDFGDYTTDTAANPVHAYADTGYYSVSLTVIHKGCRSTLLKPAYLHIVPPKADFAYILSDCSKDPTTVVFSDSSQGAHTWAWNFGDGSPIDTQRNPVHIFPAEGTYSVTLTVTNTTTGCTDSKILEIAVGSIHASFTSNVVEGCYPLTVRFSDSSLYANSWLWSFGDGSTSAEKNPQHTYADTGEYTVRLTVYSSNGACSDSIVQPDYITAYGVKGKMVATPATGCIPLTVTFEDQSVSFMGSIVSTTWKYGVGTDSSAGLQTTYTYNTRGTFTGKMKTTDSHGCVANLSKSINTKTIETNFKSDTVACPGEPVRFTSTPRYSTAQSNIWDFGDGATVTTSSTNASHIYAASGVYTVTLISRTSTGCYDTLVSTNVVTIAAPNADFHVNTNFAPCPPFPVRFYNATDRTDLNWLWHFGDGDTSTAKDPWHVYFYPGDYDVSLVVTNTSGCYDSITYTDLIKVRGPVGNFTVTPDSGCVPLTVNVSGTTESTVSIIGAMGDGTAYNGSTDITHTYQNVGKYYPVFTLTDSLGCEVSYRIDTVVVGLIPYPNLPTDTTVCRGNNTQFSLSYGDHFLWSSNADSTRLDCDTCRNVTSYSRDTITYYVTATTNVGCVAKDTVTLNVDPLPQIFPGIRFRICPNDTLQLSAGDNVSDVTWSPSLYMDNPTIVNPRVWTPDTMTYRVTAVNSTGCTISRAVNIYPINKVSAELTYDGDTVKCEGGEVHLGVKVHESSYNDTSFQWIPSTYLSESDIPNPVLNAPPGDYIYQVIVRSSSCEADTHSIQLSFAPIPTVEAGDEQTVAQGTTVQLWAASREQVAYNWIPVADSLSCTDCRRPSVTVTQDQTIPVTVISQFGCTDTAYVKLSVVLCDEKMVFVPNTFTPNGDGLNDLLYVRGTGLRSLDYFRLYDRWGQLVWETHDISQGWDGTSRGKKAEMATYVYLLKATCSSGADIEKSGNVTIIR